LGRADERFFMNRRAPGPEFAVRRATSLIEAAVSAYQDADDGADEASRARRLDRAMHDFREALLAWGASRSDWLAPAGIGDTRLRWAMDVMGAALAAYEHYRGLRSRRTDAREDPAEELDRRFQHMIVALDKWQHRQA
jgi:hypothetical protein